MTKKESKIHVPKLYSGRKDALNTVEWEKSPVSILDENGMEVYVQPDVEFPKGLSQNSRNIVASRYFYGDKDRGERENSYKQLVGRVTAKFEQWAVDQKYMTSKDAKSFGNQLRYQYLHRQAFNNSPVWFNVGVDLYKAFIESHLKSAEPRKLDQRHAYIIGPDGKSMLIPPGQEYEKPQTAACFIQPVDDTMEDIMELVRKEAMLFKYGSGSGTDLSTLRSSKEKLSGGGTPSGPPGYLPIFDEVAGVIKSGGKTRRAAKMNSLQTWHPDIMDFIGLKEKQEEIKDALIDFGYSSDEASEIVSLQNVNLSIRVSDDFMKAAEEGKMWQTRPVHNKDLKMPEYNAKDVLRRAAEAAHKCGDPGVQYDSTINRWNTCANSGRINASNPCSEFMFVDDSACNLASINLMEFFDENGIFQAERFAKTVGLTIISQDLLVDASSYPVAEIAENSHRFRPLGLGYGNAGATLMYLGKGYDSKGGRATMGSLTALMTGLAYLKSSEIARRMGPFAEFKKNREPMMQVMEMHRKELEKIDFSKLPRGLESMIEGPYSLRKVWDRVIAEGAKYGFRNAQTTLLAPTGTISFLMDSDTTGIEPDIALVKTKRLSGGGIMEMENKTIAPALHRLGYSAEQITSMINHLREKKTLEGSCIKDEHLSVFDCSLKPKNGTRCLSPYAHIKMMAAVQPFLSGAISKTVNLPKEATVDDIYKIFTDGWKEGLKAVAIYRDGSKRGQPLTASGSDKEKKHDIWVRGDNGKLRPINPKTDKGKLEGILSEVSLRKRMPATRRAITHKFGIPDASGIQHEAYLTIGLYDDGTPGEMFITMAKEGSMLGGAYDSFGTAISLCLQYGVPFKELASKFKHQKFDPYGWVTKPEDRGKLEEGLPDIQRTDSFVDYIFRWGEKMFPNGKFDEKRYLTENNIQNTEMTVIKQEPVKEEKKEPVAETRPAENPAPESKETPKPTQTLKGNERICSVCQRLMVPADSKGCKFRCLECGNEVTSGCEGL